MIEIEILLTFVYFLECTVVQCKIEIVTAMNVRESETYLPISRSFSASKQCRNLLDRDISGTTFNINNRK